VLGILGGGISGLSLAHLYEGASEVLEKEDRIGGHCRSHQKDGFWYDEGGHILFSRDEDVLRRMLAVLGDNVERRRRNNKIWYKGRFVKYPFENGLDALDKEDVFDCLYSYLNNDYPEPTNFKEWIYHTFGRGIAERYLVPYNEKIWKTSLHRMTTDWAGGRVPKPPAEDVIKSALGISTEGYTHQLYYYYPREGGFEALPRALAGAAAPRCTIRTGFATKSVRRDGGRWTVSDGSEERAYERLVSTIPVQDFVALLGDVPGYVERAVQGLRYNPSVFVMLGLEDCLARDVTAVYFPQPELVFHRVCFMHTFADGLAPPGKLCAVAEISCRGEDENWLASDDAIAQKVIDGLAGEGFFNPSQVITTDVRRVRHSYVVYDHAHRRNTELIRSYCGELGIELLGRMSQFEYWNTDQCFAEAMRLAERLNAGVGALP